MDTLVKSSGKDVVIGTERPLVLIGERINPTGRRKLTAKLQIGDVEMVCNEAIKQVEYGADILDVNVGTSGIDELVMLPKVVQAIMGAVDVPLCFDSHNVQALEAALKIYKGKAIINSVNGQERCLTEILSLVKKYNTAVIGLTMDDKGIPPDVETRLQIAHKIIKHANKMGIPLEDIIIDTLVTTVCTDYRAALITLETISRVNKELGVNQSLGASNISFGLPDREVLNFAFLALAVDRGVTCPCVNVAKVKQNALAIDLILGRDRHGLRYTRGFRQLQGLLKTQQEFQND
jgi:5-methyltetrahydrofolate--homocysteine methyltransferase